MKETELLPKASSQGSSSDPILEHPLRPKPNPATGALSIDPEIELMAKGMSLTIEFFYSTLSPRNDEYGKKRSSSVHAYVAAASGDTTDIGVWRGNLEAYVWHQNGTSGGITTFSVDATTYSPTTLVFDGSKYQEHFPDGSLIEYGTNLISKYFISRAISPAGAVHTFSYGSGSEANYIKTIQVADGRKVTFTYAASTTTSLLSSVQDWGGRFWTFQYDSNRQLTTFTTPLGCQTGYSYATFSSVDLLNVITDPRGYSTIYNYDSHQRVTTMSMGTAVWTYTYGGGIPGGLNGSTEMTPTGAITTYNVDTKGLITSINRPEGYTSTYAYDANRFQISETVPSGRRFSYSYDSYGRVKVSQDALDNLTTNQYDASGNLTTITNALGYISSMVYDSSRNMTASVDPLGRRTSYSYDSYGQRTSVTDPRGLITTYNYDSNGCVASLMYSDGSVATSTFDSLNRKLSSTDPLGRTTSYGYDAADHIVSVTNAAGEMSRTVYDTCLVAAQVSPMGYRTSMTYGRFSNAITTQDPLGKVWSQT